MKLLTAISIIGLGILGACIVVQKPELPAPSSISETNPSQQEASKNNPVAGISLENLTSQLVTNIQNSLLPSSENQQPTTAETNNKPTNLTDLLSQNFGSNILISNPDGPENVDGQTSIIVPDSEAVSEDLVAKAVDQFDPKTLRPVINDADIKVSVNNSKEALAAYFEASLEINKKAEEMAPAQETVSDNEAYIKTLSQTIAAFNFIYEQLLNLETPSSLISIHKKTLELTGTQINIFKNLLNYDQDPVYAILSMEESKNVEIEFLALRVETEKIISKNGL